MSLFSKKLSLEDIFKAIESLSEEEKSQVKAMLEPKEELVEEPAKEMVEEPTSEPVDEKAEEVQEGKEMVEESSNEEIPETPTEEETEQPVEENIEEVPQEPVIEKSPEMETPEVEQTPEVKEQEKMLDDSQTAKIQALEERCAMLEEKLEQVLNSLDNKDFGLEPGVPEGGGEDHNRMNAVMRGYAGGNAKKYL